MIARHIILLCGALAAAVVLAQTGAAAEPDAAKPAANHIGQGAAKNGAAKNGAAEKGAAENGAVWSEAVNGLQARIELKHAQVFNGTPIIATTLCLRNVNEVANAMRVPWASARMNFRVVDAAGKELPIGHKGAVIYSGIEVPQVDLVLPYKGILSFDISHHGLGIFGD
jgi:hypothetical protein